MNAYFLLLMQLVLSIGVSLLTLHVLSRSLFDLLCRICPDEQAALFWQSYTKIMLLLAPLLLVLGVTQLSTFGDPLDSLRVALIAALGGLLLALFAVGMRVGSFIRPPMAQIKP
jgi:hypothetical protein